MDYLLRQTSVPTVEEDNGLIAVSRAVNYPLIYGLPRKRIYLKRWIDVNDIVITNFQLNCQFPGGGSFAST